jgi:hypothetical protein
MSDGVPDLHMLNVVVADMPAGFDFYRRLGVAVPGEDPAGAHVQLRMPSGFSLELDTAESVQLWHAAWRTDPASVGVVIGFLLATREAVDERYVAFRRLLGGALCDRGRSDGNDVGVMSPIDDSRRTWPRQESPAP